MEVDVRSYPGFSRAAVLVPLYEADGDLKVILTVRTETVETHKGQVSFPGGTRDASDQDDIQTALRESREEIGLDPASVRILGLLDDLVTPTGFVITPVVGAINEMPTLKPNSSEVAEVLSVPLSFFEDEKNGRWEMRERAGLKVKVWFFQCGERLIWGATAGILKNLIETTNTYPPGSG
jgi:8-oxo-dGTP pyrophosphatase MutT (NUDIX family)